VDLLVDGKNVGDGTGFRRCHSKCRCPTIGDTHRTQRQRRCRPASCGAGRRWVRQQRAVLIEAPAQKGKALGCRALHADRKLTRGIAQTASSADARPSAFKALRWQHGDGGGGQATGQQPDITRALSGRAWGCAGQGWWRRHSCALGRVGRGFLGQ
jgi:hypothetical protein